MEHPLILSLPELMAESLDQAEQLLSRGHTLAGCFSYDLGRLLEPAVGLGRADPLGFPPCALGVVGTTVPDAAKGPSPPPRRPELSCDFTAAGYRRAVRRCLDYIRAGDVFQVNLSQRFTVELTMPPRALFRRLQQTHPARYGASIDLGRWQLLSNSPELFLRVDRLPDGSRRIVSRPIKGTRPRGPGMARRLEGSAKDRAELAMIVDLQRNDLGRICKHGSVRVTQPRVIEAHPTVYHGVAQIEGVLRDPVTLRDILAATFPCGSITGCPKIRAMQIIDELEPVRRGPYCGAIGWLGPDGSLELAVAIRTMIVHDGLVHVSVGGGIVADSDPQAEYDETLVKARAMFGALGLA